MAQYDQTGEWNPEVSLHDGVEAVKMGCATAGISVTRAGTAPSMPIRSEVDKLIYR